MAARLLAFPRSCEEGAAMRTGRAFAATVLGSLVVLTAGACSRGGTHRSSPPADLPPVE